MKNYSSEMHSKIYNKKEDSSGKNGALSANVSFSNSVKDKKKKRIKDIAIGIAGLIAMFLGLWHLHLLLD